MENTKLKTLAGLREGLPLLRGLVPGYKIVFTNGCFDILHAGHIKNLTQAKKLGSILVVGLNSDSGVRRLKGAERPINGEQERAYVLSALECVDFICFFDTDLSTELIDAVRPDVYVKGGDYKAHELIEGRQVREMGGEVVIIPRFGGYSTTSIAEKI